VDVGEQVAEEARARAQALADRLVRRLLGRAGRGGRAEQRRVLAEVQGDAAGPPAERAGADPHDLAGGAQLVEPRR
jgi:hypothetical protein